MREPSQLDKIKAHIKSQGPTRLAERTKVARRTLQYIASGDKIPNYATMEKILRDMEATA